MLEARNLTVMDIGIGGRPGKSDPYLRVKLGKENVRQRVHCAPPPLSAWDACGRVLPNELSRERLIDEVLY